MASKYAQAWAILKEYKSLTLTLDTPRVERTVRKAIVEHKKLDTNKNLLERIQVRKSISDGRVQLHFRLIPTTRRLKDFFDLTPVNSSAHSSIKSIRSPKRSSKVDTNELI